jgi:hypothetical protein
VSRVWVVVRCGVGGAALRDVATALGWSGALGESVGAWFGVLFVWAPNGRRADGDITDHRPPHAPAPPTRVARSGSFWAPYWSPKRPGPSFHASRWDRSHLDVEIQRQGAIRRSSTTRIADPKASGRRANATSSRPRSLPSVRNGPRWHAIHRLSGTPRTSRATQARATDQVRPAASAPRRQSWAVRYPSRQGA